MVNLEGLDLSRLKVLRSLYIKTWCLGDKRLTTILGLLSTITSPLFSELIIAIARYETHLPWAAELFRMLGGMKEARHIKLVFSLETSDPLEARSELAEALYSATVTGLLDFLDSPPTIHVVRFCPYRRDFLDID